MIFDTPRYIEVADPLLVVGGLPKIELLAKVEAG